jgi:hypothetical protein
MKAAILALLMWSAAAFGQSSVTIPAQTFITPLTINGTTIQLTITVPSQTVALPTTAPSSTLPAGVTFSTTGGLTVAGPITATSLNLTSGPALPTCTSGLYLWQLVSGVLQPACYTPSTYSPPPLTVSQAPTPINTVTIAH